MKVLVVGSGGREHTLAWKLRQSTHVDEIFCAPGNAGTARIGKNVALSDCDLDGLVSFAKENEIALTVVGPEAPLVAGIVDRFQSEGLKVMGPSATAAQLEGSKVFTKDFLKNHGIPTAAFEVFENPADAEARLKAGAFKFPTVVKADGLAAGKGVLICANLEEALDAVKIVMRDKAFGTAGAKMVIEEFLVGEEASFMVFTDGVNILPMVPSQDHKAIFEGDKGPNTGGMGAYSVDFLLSPELRQGIIEDIIEPTVRGMAAQGAPFRGILYAGLMMTAEGPKVLEYNVRFGDPETQVVLPRLKSDLYEICMAIAEGDLSSTEAEWDEEACVCVVMASQGYPGPYQKGKEVSGIEMAEEGERATVFHAGTAVKEDKVVTSGGRVLGVTSRGETLGSAIMKAYEAVNKINFDGSYYRRDIAAKGLKKLENN